MAGLVPAICVSEGQPREGMDMAKSKAGKVSKTKIQAGKIGIENVIRPGPP
jgi:hypothetical protein